MLNLSKHTTFISDYPGFLAQNNIAKAYEPFYLKWLQYYLDFCQKYSHKSGDSSSLQKITQKLKDKKQPDSYISQAEHAIQLSYKLINVQQSRKLRAKLR
jgi:hypothetical protein